ncbi:MAG: hypothetical protein AAB489_00470 [Patescibacteria group bacterium]
MQRQLSLLIGCSLLLASCGGNGEQAKCTRQYWDGIVGLCMPAGWVVIEHEQLRERGIPEDVIVAFKREKAVAGQFPTVTVTQEALKQPMDSSAYSDASVRSVAVLPGYKQIDTRAVRVDDASVDLHIFTAQPSADEPERRFYQVSAVSGPSGYSVTALTPLAPPSDVESEIERMMGSITFKAPEGGASSEAGNEG